MNRILTKRQIISLTVVIGLVAALFVAVFLTGQRQEIRKKASGSNSSGVILSLVPTNDTFTVGAAPKLFELHAQFTDAASSERIDYFYAEINFDQNYLNLSPDHYIDTSTSGLTKIFRVDGPVAANTNGKIVIELGVNTPNTGPFTFNASTGNTLTVAKLYFIANPLAPQNVPTTAQKSVTLANADIVSNVNNSSIPATYQTLTYMINGAGISPTLTVSPTVTVTGGPSGTVTPSVTLTPTVSITPTGNLTPTATITPTFPPVTVLPTVPPVSLTPTPLSGREKYTIDVGDTQRLSINIGPGLSPKIRFAAKLALTQNNPDLYFRLRVKDDLAFVTGGTTGGDTCTNAPPGTSDFWIPVRATNGVYKPVSSISVPIDPNLHVATVSSDGWVTLDGIATGRYYTLYLKGPKTRGTRVLSHFVLSGDTNISSQDFNWTDDSLALMPGDLPDPNNGNKQHCTVNIVDISLIESMLGHTDQTSLDMSDVNYDGLIDGADISKVVQTLSTRPDDDN